MYQRKRRNRWFATALAIGTFLIIAIGAVVFYANSHERRLLSYARSVANLPEVSVVLAISSFDGPENYLVARVQLVDGSQQVYFIQDNTVAQQVLASDLMSADQLIAKHMPEVDVVRNSLGRMGGEPVYELVANTPDGVKYVVANALTGEAVLSFTLD
ncbi:MAG: hypothetical protein FWF59_01225 [Turicibacter sp.]|nr:hypothetical protein [Turicibacter sp.]